MHDAIRRGLGSMAGPVLADVAAIGTMLTKAWAFSPLAGAGATIFAASDSLIALDRFRHPIRGRDLAILTTYWTGQALIVLSAFRAG